MLCPAAEVLQIQQSLEGVRLVGVEEFIRLAESYLAKPCIYEFLSNSTLLRLLNRVPINESHTPERLV